MAEAAVIGLPDAERGERVCAVRTLHAGTAHPSLADVVAYLRDSGRMPQKLLEQLEIVDELPRNGLGKTSRRSRPPAAATPHVRLSAPDRVLGYS
ncbi:AMP-binding enzyme [Parafrankia sp. FMc2]|uniref:AMP-binding enzyme n=1 Tax=Parafrankia sp. FMc2 TaxID=3233196 RepID=UPI0034D3AF29